jgi:hypothetical protein
MMNDSVDAWNCGDPPAFAAWYEDSPETTLIGKVVVRAGIAAILERYRKANATREAMGPLTFFGDRSTASGHRSGAGYGRVHNEPQPVLDRFRAATLRWCAKPRADGKSFMITPVPSDTPIPDIDFNRDLPAAIQDR